MKKTIVASISYRGMQPQTEACLRALSRAGADISSVTGCGDLALARSLVLSKTLKKIREGRDADSVLVVDDDMVFNVEAAQRLVDRSRELREPVSGVYGTADGRVVHQAIDTARGRRWLCGFGFMAVPVACLLDVEARLPSVNLAGELVHAWCGSGIHPAAPDRWTIDDFWFCLHFGGICLEPIGVGHLKMAPLYPDMETLRKIAAGESLPTGREELSPLKSEIG